jgi:hypothetical protein
VLRRRRPDRSVAFAFAGYPVAVLPTTIDGTWNVIFASHCIACIDIPSGKAKTVTHVSEHL